MQGIAKFNTFKPAEDLLPADNSPLVIFCCIPTEDRKDLNGCFRLSVRAKGSFKILFDLPKLFKTDLMPGYQCVYVRKPEDFIFHNNCWYSEWISFNDEVAASKIKFIPVTATSNPEDDDVVQARARMIFSENGDHPGSFRLEVTVGPNDEYMLIRVRFIPQLKSVCKTHSYLKGGDVATIPVMHFRAAGMPVRQMNPQKLDKITFGPVLFYDGPVLTDDQYVECVSKGWPSLLYHMKAHKDYTTTSIESYIQNPTANSGNSMRYNWASKPNASVASLVQQSHNKGTYQLACFGTKVDVTEFIENFEGKAHMYTILSRRSNTWSSYMTHWRAYVQFCQINLLSVSVPVSVNDLIDYVIFLRENRCLEVSSIRNYLSGLRMLHTLNDKSDANLDSSRLEMVLQGMANVAIVESIENETESFQRNVLSFEILQVLGHFLFDSNCYDDYNKQVIWCACLLAFFGCFRMGEILSPKIRQFDPITDLTWQKIRVEEPDKHFLITNMLPKVSEDPKGDVVDIFSFEADPRFCPITQLNKLMNMTPLNTKKKDPVFRFNNGTMLTPSKMNAILKQYLQPHFPEAVFTGHSFRAGLASLIACHPEYFSENDAKLVGRWRSDTVKKYQRTKGISNKAAHNRVKQFLTNEF